MHSRSPSTASSSAFHAVQSLTSGVPAVVGGFDDSSEVGSDRGSVQGSRAPTSSAPSRRRMTSVIDQTLTRSITPKEVNQSAYLLLFSELVQYCRNRVVSVMDLEMKLAAVGKRMGMRFLDLIIIRYGGRRSCDPLLSSILMLDIVSWPWVFLRDRISKRETRILGILNFLVTSLWKSVFGKQADSLKKMTDGKCRLE